MKKRYVFYSGLLVIGSGVTSFLSVFSVPRHPQLLTVNRDKQVSSSVCYQSPSSAHIDKNGRLNLLVWNIYKQKRQQWSKALSRYSQHSDLVFLQEASMTNRLKDWINRHHWDGTQANAFRILGDSTGVLNLAKTMPSLACAYTEVEPWIRLPKSGIYAEYALSNGQTLASVNIHAVNFTYGTAQYKEQIQRLIDRLSRHKGPIIIAGDFNSWSDKRMRVLHKALTEMGLKEVSFHPDNRIRFMTGLVLDHVFYRGLTLKKAQVPTSDASDHNPMLVSFELE